MPGLNLTCDSEIASDIINIKAANSNLSVAILGMIKSHNRL